MPTAANMALKVRVNKPGRKSNHDEPEARKVLRSQTPTLDRTQSGIGATGKMCKDTTAEASLRQVSVPSALLRRC